MNSPWLSVIMPIYNGAKFISAALESIGAEQDINLEIIAVDDGSTDETVDVLRQFSQRIPLTIVERGVGNWVENTNFGMEQARGEWMCFLHQDDLWRPGRLYAVRQVLNANPSLVLHAADFIDRKGHMVGRWRCPLPTGERGSPPDRTVARLLVQNFIPLPAALFRRIDALQVGGLNPGLWFTADWDFWLKLAALGRTIYLPQSLAAFRLHSQSQTVVRSDKCADMRQQHQIVFDQCWANWRERLAQPERIECAAQLSREINLALAARHHGEPIDWKRLMAAMAVGPGTWSYCLKNSRLVERVVSRLRAGLY
jgi:hypothetical protein